MNLPPAATMFEKIWQAHIVSAETPDTPAVLYIDMHFTHEVSSPAAFSLLQAQGLPLRRPDRTLATLDHSTPTISERVSGEAAPHDQAALQVRKLEENAASFGMELFGMKDPRRGIVHVIGPELGITQPGMTIVCGDSHTSTHGAFGALAFGIGSTEAAHVLATQCILQRKLKTFEIRADGALPAGVTAKDLILAIILKVGVGAGTGHVIEYRGTTISGLSMEQRMTVCNMSIEAGARAGMIAPDETTFAYIAGRPRAPNPERLSAAIARWTRLGTDEHAQFDKRASIDASQLEPMITYGTNPGMVIPISGHIPAREGDTAFEQALGYMGFHSGESMLGKPIDVAFIGSCTNGRIEDLYAAARVLKGRKIAKGVRMLIVPGSQKVKREAEALGLADIFMAAGAEWRESGCSMCVGMNGDTVARGQYAVSTSNRNFEGRQGPGARTLLASPLTAAASAVSGRITDPRDML
jgi:3-isopropylmalate/(R)-2-methylmalate dehydratase large subunit